MIIENAVQSNYNFENRNQLNYLKICYKYNDMLWFVLVHTIQQSFFFNFGLRVKNEILSS